MNEHGRRDDDGFDEEHERRLGRREFLKGGLVLGAASLLVPRVEKLLSTQAAQRLFVPSGQPTFTRWLRRREDFLHLYFEFFNLRLDPTGTKLVRVSQSATPYVVITFPPQYVIEEAMPVTGSPPNEQVLPKVPPVQARLAGNSRIAFSVPPFVDEIPFSAEGLLSWEELSPSIVPSASIQADDLAASGAPPLLRAPGPRETAIEVPWWLVISPTEISTWRHRTGHATANGRTELWHTALAASERDLPLPGRPAPGERLVRGIWMRDPGFAEWVCERRTGQNPTLSNKVQSLGFPTSVSPLDAAEIVLNSGYWEPGPPPEQPYTPAPIRLDRLALSALGAWVSADAVWPEFHPQAGLREWLHRGTLGRDVYVRTVQEGHLFPFGHRAIRVEITERTPHAIQNTKNPAAYLFQRIFYIPLESEKQYPPPGQPSSLKQPVDGRRLPFTRIRCTTRITPSVKDGQIGTFNVDAISVPTLDSPYPFDFIGIDRDGNETAFKMPVVWVKVPEARKTDLMRSLADEYNKADTPARPPVDLGGRRVALATSGTDGDTTVEAETINIVADKPPNLSASERAAVEAALRAAELPAFWPAMQSIDARLPAADLTASAVVGATKLRYDDSYLATVGGNTGQVFALLVQPANLRFGSDGRAGALVNPDFKIEGLSRTHGPVGDVATTRAGGFKPGTFFAGLDAKLLGGVGLADVIKGGNTGMLERIPKLLQRPEGPPGAPERLVTQLRWSPELQAHGLLKPETDASLAVEAVYITELAQPEKSSASIVADLRNVALSFPETASIFDVRFKRIQYSSKQGAKPSLYVDLAGVDFADKGPLKLVENLRDFLGPALEAAAGQHGPSVDVTTEAIETRYTLPVPAVEVGIFLLENVTVIAGLHVPLGAEPVRASYAFSSREDPFLVTVSGIGGGGFLFMRVGLDEIEAVEGSLEFGGKMSLNLGVAKGSVHALGGVYYKVPPNGGNVALEGYYRVGGSLRVLGLVTVSTEFYMGLKWVPASEKVVGKASLEIEIDMGLFSKSVTLSVEKRFGGSGADPSFRQLQTESDWTEYCRAFASEVT